jgi:hypothetical protein
VARRRLTAAGVTRRPSFQTRYARRDFSGEMGERAYLLGFRLGDLHVALQELSVVVKCTSTRAEQVALFRELFDPYGHVYTDEATIARRARQSVGMQVALNRTFEFLVPKEDRVPAWVLEGDEVFYAYFAGYLDAEGYVKSIPSDLRVELRSYDRHVLMQLGEELNKREIVCPPAALCVPAGYVNRYGIRSNGDLWRLGIGRAASLHHLFTRIDAHVRHAKRRQDMMRCWEIAQARLSSPTTWRRLWAVSGREPSPPLRR